MALAAVSCLVTNIVLDLLLSSAGAGINVRINDVGVDANHPEFAANFDVATSCPDYLPVELGADAEISHGTTCAAIAAGGANDQCSVGMAPDAKLSSCRMIGNESPEMQDYILSFKFLYDEDIPDIHVSSNSYGDDACVVIETGEEEGEERKTRRQLQATCPFDPSNEPNPCGDDSFCAGADWSRTIELSEDCQSDVIVYCLTNYELDVLACSSYLDLFVKCGYNTQSPEEIAAMTQGVTLGRGGKGIVYLYAAGNEFDIGEDLNFEGSLNSRFTIT